MAIADSYDFSVSRDDIIKAAMRVIGVLAPGDGAPSAAEVSYGAQALNMMIKAWQAQRIGLWLNQRVVLALAYETASYSLGPTGTHCTASMTETAIATAGTTGDGTIDVDSITGISSGDYLGIELDDNTMQWDVVNGAPAGTTVTLTGTLDDDVSVDATVLAYTTKIQRPLSIVHAALRDSDNNDTEMTAVSLQEYFSLSTKTASGVPSQFYYDPQTTNGALYIWPTPAEVSSRIYMTIRRPVSDFDATSDTPDFPQEWFEALKFNLAVRLAPEYPSANPLRVQNLAMVAALAQSSLDAAMGFDHEYTSIFFSPDSR